MRADALRNRDRILTAASAAVAAQGADASLEEIARTAGVGSATLHRHFPSRHALLEAVFTDRVDALCAKAADAHGTGDPGTGLVDWLLAVGAHAAANRGLGAALAHGADPAFGATCHAKILAAAAPLFDDAARAGAIRDDVAVTDVLTLVAAISTATEHDPDGPEAARRLLALALDGVRPR